MVKKFLIFCLALVFVFNSAGCSERIKRKFIRTSEKKQVEPPVFHPEDYKKAFPNAQLYLNHYTLWKVSESELITRLGQNSKRDKSTAVACLSELTNVKDYLVEAKQAELEPYIAELDKIVKEILSKDLSYGKAYSLRRELEKHKRNVEKKFSFHKMTEFIKPDEEQEQEKKE